jgi:hypothetical protein
MRSDQIRQTLVRQRQGHGDSLRSYATPPLGQVPERQEEPVIHALMVGDCQRDRQMVRAARAASKQLHAELRPGIHARHQTVIENGESRRLEHDPSHFGVDV